MSTGVLLAVDQALVRAGFAMILDAQPDLTVVGEACDGQEAIDLAVALDPDVVLMDVRMPELDGIAATAAITAAQPGVRVLVLTTFDLDEYVYDALHAGASGFLLKDVGRDDLVAAVRVVAAGDALLAPSVTRRLLVDFVRNRAEAPARPDVPALTGREQETLALLALGLSNAAIAERLVVSERTVKTHVGNVLHKGELVEVGLVERDHGGHVDHGVLRQAGGQGRQEHVARR
ncbi:MAG: response regulator [Nocardioidaceae bacterium]